MTPTERITRAIDTVARVAPRMTVLQTAADAAGRGLRTVQAWCADPSTWAPRLRPPTERDAESIEAAVKELAVRVSETAARAAEEV